MRKRKRDDDLNELLPSGPPNEGASMGSLEFNEVFDEEASSRRVHSSVKKKMSKVTRILAGAANEVDGGEPSAGHVCMGDSRS